MPSNVIAQEVFSSSPFKFGIPSQLSEQPVVDKVEQPPLHSPTEEPNGKGYEYEDDDYEDDPDVQEEEPNEYESDPLEDVDQEETANSLYDAFKALGYISDDTEIPKAKNVTEFLTNYEKAKADKIDKILRDQYAETYSEERLKYVDYLMKGGDPTAVSSFYVLANLPIDDEDSDGDNRKSLIMAMYKDKGLSDKRAASMFSTVYDEGEDTDEAQTAKAYFKDKHDAQLQEINDVEQAQERAVVEQNDKLVSSLKQIIKQRKVDDVEISEDEAKDLEPYMFGQNVITDIVDPRTGQTYKGKVSKYYVDYQNFFSKPESLIKLARFIRSNGDIHENKEKIKEELSQELIKKLNGFRGKNNEKGSPRRKNAFLS